MNCLLDREAYANTINDYVPDLSAKLHGLLPESIIDRRKKTKANYKNDIFAISKGNRQDDVKEAVAFFFPKLVERIILSLSEIIESQLNRVKYLGPLREYPPRHFAFKDSTYDLLKVSPEASWSILLSNHKVRNRVNTWLHNEKISTPYTINVSYYITDNSLLQHLSVNLHDVEFEVASRDAEWKEAVEKYLIDGEASILSEEEIEMLDEAWRDFMDESSEDDYMEMELLDSIKNIQILVKEIELRPDKIDSIFKRIPIIEKDIIKLRSIGQNILNEHGISIPLLEEQNTQEEANAIRQYNKINNKLNELSLLVSTYKEFEEYSKMSASNLLKILNKELSARRKKLEKLKEKYKHYNPFEPDPEAILGDKYNYLIYLTDPDGEAQKIYNKIKFSGADLESELVLKDEKSNSLVSLRDVGIGFNQILPILTYSYYLQNSILVIEEPEVSLHPGLQAELGDLFIESTLGANGNNVILETHSEHLILRLLRRIRETTEAKENGKLKEIDFPITPDDVSVIYAERRPEGTKFHHMEITDDGDFKDRWPEGFFTERAEELF